MQLTNILIAVLPALALAAPSKRGACDPIPAPGVPAINLSKAAGAPSNSQTLTWNIPANSPGPCALVATWPQNYPISSWGNAQVNVIDVNGPAPGAIVGTVTFASDPYGPRKQYINSFACRPNMQYKLVLAGEGAGGVSFAQSAGVGVGLTVGC